MSNPVEILGRTSRRIAQVAAARTLAYGALPALVAIALALSLGSIGQATWERRGYVLSAANEEILFKALLAVAALTVIAAAALACRAYLRALDFVAAAEQIDEAVGGHQQVLTLATLADPSAPEASKARRSPLFPLLWKSAIAFLESFDPKRAFPLQLGPSITRSSILAGAIALVTILATFGLVRPPTPLESEAAKLREIASEIEKSSTGPGDLALASSVRDTADALESPKLPPEEKKKKLEHLMQQMASHGEEKQGGGSEKGNGGGNAPSKDGKGQGGNGAGSGSGSSNNPGKESGQNQPGKGSGQNDKSQNKNSIELQNEISKAEAQIENEEKSNPGTTSPSSAEKDKGDEQKQGKGANEKMAGNQPNPNQPGNVPTQGTEGNRNLPESGGKNMASGKDQGSNAGEAPSSELATTSKTQRFSKGGNGDALNIHDARYVMFRLPGAIPVGSGGITVLDPNRAKASTPYVNAPLKETSNDAPPDERQLVPPRYRDLIH